MISPLEPRGRKCLPSPMRYILRSSKLTMDDDGERTRSESVSPPSVTDVALSPGGASMSCPYMYE
jgi:hypothetical protein